MQPCELLIFYISRDCGEGRYYEALESMFVHDTYMDKNVTFRGGE